MKKLLLPIDGSPRSLRAIQVVKQSYSPDETEVTILLVVPEARPSKMTDENDEVTPMPDHDEIVTDPQTAEEARLLVESFAKMLPAFKTETALRFGKPGPEIVNFAKDGTFDSILMTRSSRGSTQKLGSVSHLRGAQRFLHHHHRSAGNLTHHPSPPTGRCRREPNTIVTQTGERTCAFPPSFPSRAHTIWIGGRYP